MKPRNQKAAQIGLEGGGGDMVGTWEPGALWLPHFALSLACFSGESGFALACPQAPRGQGTG